MLVPKEPTEAMLAAGAEAGDHAVQNGEVHPTPDSVGLVYSAMLAAAGGTE